jgi:hypothetical protein
VRMWQGEEEASSASAGAGRACGILVHFCE